MTRHVIEIPEDIERALEQRASDAGTDVPRIIQTAIVAFIRQDSTVSHGRRPDPPLEAIESIPPCDLPRSEPRPIMNQQASQRVPDYASQIASPGPQRVRLVGRLAAVHGDANVFDLFLDDANHVSVRWNGGDITAVTGVTNERVLILGTAIYGPTGELLRIDADDVTRSSDEGSFFSAVPRAISPGFDLDEIRREQRHKPGLSAIIGQWPGDESDEEVAAALRELS